MMASGGLPWMIIPADRRAEYMACLEAASVEQDIEPLARLLGSLATRRVSEPAMRPAEHRVLDPQGMSYLD